MIYFIAYDLNDDDGNEKDILAAIGRLGATKICMANGLLLDFDGTRDDVYDNIVAQLKPSDRVFISLVEKESYAGRTYKMDGVWDWLRERFT